MSEKERYTVFANLKIGSALVALVCIAVAPNASAVTAEESVSSTRGRQSCGRFRKRNGAIPRGLF